MQGEKAQPKQKVVVTQDNIIATVQSEVDQNSRRWAKFIQLVSDQGNVIKEQRGKIQELENKCAQYDKAFKDSLDAFQKFNTKAEAIESRDLKISKLLKPLQGLIEIMNIVQELLECLNIAYKELDSVRMSFSRIVLTSTAIGTGLSVLCAQKPTVNFVFNRLPLTLVDRVFLSHMPNMLYINSDVARLGLSMGYVIGLGHCAFNLGYAVKAMVSGVEQNGQNYLDYAANTVSVLSLAYAGYQMRQGAIGFADVKVQAVVCAVSALVCFRKYMNQQEKIDWSIPVDDAAQR